VLVESGLSELTVLVDVTVKCLADPISTVSIVLPRIVRVYGEDPALSVEVTVVVA
jgi:hypothetical protein